MKAINIFYGDTEIAIMDADIAEVPDDIHDDIQEWSESFLKWLTNEDVDHPYWVYRNGKKSGLGFRTAAFVNYLNDNPLRDRPEKARLIEEDVAEFVKGAPIIYL